MQLLALDENFQNLKYIKYINLQWNREYYSIGNFSVQITEDNYLPEMKYIYTEERPEVGVIQKVEIQNTVKGTFIQLEGMFLESILNDKTIYPTYYGSGDIGQSVLDMVDKYKDDIPLLNVSNLSLVKSNNATWQETGGNLAKVAYSKLATQQMSCRCRYDYENDKIWFEVWQGKDKTQDQEENSFVVFSSGFRNLTNIKASFDCSNFKNYAIVAGEGEGKDRIIANVDLSNGGYKKKVFIDAKDLMFDAEKQTKEEYIKALEQRGLEKLLDYKVINNIEIDISESTFKYLRDFDLGDVADVIIESIGVSMTARIVTIREVFKNNNHTVTIELGDKKLTSIQKARLK